MSRFALTRISLLSGENFETLANLLVKTTNMSVLEIRDGLPVKPNHVYVLTPNYDVLLEDRNLRLASRVCSAIPNRDVE